MLKANGKYLVLTLLALTGCATEPQAPMQHYKLEKISPYLHDVRTTSVGYDVGKIRTVDAGAAIGAIQTIKHFVVPENAKIFTMNSQCGVSFGPLTTPDQIPTGVAENVYLVSKPSGSVYLVYFKDFNSFVAGEIHHMYLAVNPDGSITNKTWAGSPQTGIRQAWGSVSIKPAGCSYHVSDMSDAKKDQYQSNTDAQIYYLGRAQSGLLNIGPSRQIDGIENTQIPAEPGTYSVAGINLRIIRVSGYKMTYEVLAKQN